METKQYLRQVRRLDTEVQTKYEQLEALRSLAEKVTSDTSSERVQTSGDTDKTGNIVAKIVELEYELNNQIDALIDHKQSVIKLIESIEDDSMRLLLTLRYLCFRSWEEIAVEMHFTYRHVHRLHSQALQTLIASRHTMS